MKWPIQICAIAIIAAGALCAQPKAGAHAPPPKGALRGGPKGLPKGAGFNGGPMLKGDPGRGPRLNAPAGNIERLLAMPSEQRERVLEKLPPAQQENLRRRFEQFDQRPPAEKARLLEMWKHFETLSPEKRDLLTHQMQAFNALPEDRRKELAPAMMRLRRASPEERQKLLENENFRSRFSEGELKMMSDIAENYPLPENKNEEGRPGGLPH